MKKFSTSWVVIPILVFICSCENSAELPRLPDGAEAISLLGDTLYVPDLPQDVEDEYTQNLERAMEDYRQDPEDAENLIWLGRRMAYLGNYRDAVRTFTEGIFKQPDNPRMYRHRGHRYITLRMFDRAIEDFNTAVTLMRNQQDEIEPDGLPNERSEPTSTLKSNVWYHLGLAHYVKGDFEQAIDAYENALELDLTNDMEVATRYWYYMALKRAGYDGRAGTSIEHMDPDIDIIENDAYLSLILVFNGVFDANRLMESSEDALTNNTIGYGIGNWHYMNGRTERAIDIWERVYETGGWASFGRIAAEAELARMQE